MLLPVREDVDSPLSTRRARVALKQAPKCNLLVRIFDRFIQVCSRVRSTSTCRNRSCCVRTRHISPSHFSIACLCHDTTRQIFHPVSVTRHDTNRRIKSIRHVPCQVTGEATGHTGQQIDFVRVSTAPHTDTHRHA